MKQRCSECQHLKSAKTGAISERYWCGLTGDGWNEKALGVYPWKSKPKKNSRRKGKMNEQEIERCLERFTMGKATDVMNFDYAGTLAYIQRLKAENAALRERLEKAVELPFIVIDKMTGKEADEYEIALHEKWANDLVYCDMEGFAIEQDGTLILLDECGQFVYCSSDRFEVVPKSRLAELKGEEK